MPLILLTGYPCSGLTHRATQLQSLLAQKISSSLPTTTTNPSTTAKPSLRIHLTSAHSIHPRTAYADVKRAEKDARAAEFSEVKRELGRDVVVVVDALNYIKGYRYQLWCYAKEVGTGCCIVHVGTGVERCREVSDRRVVRWKESQKNSGDNVVKGEHGKGVKNGDVEEAGEGKRKESDFAAEDNEEPYDPDVFENLIYRYEEPNGMSRWDSPLFTVLWDDKEPPVDAIWEALVGKEGKGKVVKSHQATVLTPPSNSSHLHLLDLTTQRVVTHILSSQRDNPNLTEMTIPNSIIPADEEGERTVELPSGRPVMLPQLQRLKRQFITLNRKHDVAVSRAGILFVEFLNEALRD